MPEPLTHEAMVALASGAVHKIDRFGPRGITLCSMDEIEAMAAVIVWFGMLHSAAGKDTL